MALQNQIFNGTTWVNSDAQTTNNTGTPVVSATSNGDGRAIADVYTLAFSSVVAGTSATVTVSTNSPNNPYRWSKAIALDGVTVHKDVIPGLDMVFSNSGSFTSSWAATVNLGEWLGTFDAFGGGAGIPSAGVRERVLNTGTGAVSSAKARILPIAKWYAKTGKVFDSLANFAEGATEKLAGSGSSRVIPYVVTISAVAGVGAAKTCTVSVDGVALPAASVRDLSTGNTQDGTNIKAISPGYKYRIISGNLTGVEFAISSGVANGDTANLLIFGTRFVQIAPDAAGVAGTYGTADVTLTESGQAAGVITAGGVAYYWRRILVPAGGNSESNPYPADVALSATETGGANWAA